MTGQGLHPVDLHELVHRSSPRRTGRNSVGLVAGPPSDRLGGDSACWAARLPGSTPRYMRAEVSGGRGEDWDVSEHALWWPPSKIAGRWLAPYLALHHEELEKAPAGLPVELRLGSPAVKRRAIIAPGAREDLPG